MWVVMTEAGASIQADTSIDVEPVSRANARRQNYDDVN